MLELVDGNITTLVRRFQVVENLLEGRLFRCRSNLDNHFRHAGQLVERKDRTAAFDELRHSAQCLLRRRIQLSQYSIGEEPYEISEVLRRVDVHVKRDDICLLLLEPMENMFDKPRLPHTPRSDQSEVASVVKGIGNRLRLLFTVAKVFRAVITRDKKRIVRLHVIPFYPLRHHRNANIEINIRLSKSYTT